MIPDNIKGIRCPVEDVATFSDGDVCNSSMRGTGRAGGYDTTIEEAECLVTETYSEHGFSSVENLTFDEREVSRIGGSTRTWGKDIGIERRVMTVQGLEILKFVRRNDDSGGKKMGEIVCVGVVIVDQGDTKHFWGVRSGDGGGGGGGGAMARIEFVLLNDVGLKLKAAHVCRLPCAGSVTVHLTARMRLADLFTFLPPGGQ